MNICDLIKEIKSLGDDQLQELVSCLSGDFDVEQKKDSTMGAMVYAFNTSRALVSDRDDSLRTQAHLYS